MFVVGESIESNAEIKVKWSVLYDFVAGFFNYKEEMWLKKKRMKNWHTRFAVFGEPKESQRFSLPFACLPSHSLTLCTIRKLPTTHFVQNCTYYTSK